MNAKAQHCYLCFAEAHPRYLPFESLAQATEFFGREAQDLARFGQRIEATLHIAPRRSEIAEYPDYVLTLGPRGGIKRERV